MEVIRVTVKLLGNLCYHHSVLKYSVLSIKKYFCWVIINIFKRNALRIDPSNYDEFKIDDKILRGKTFRFVNGIVVLMFKYVINMYICVTILFISRARYFRYFSVGRNVNKERKISAHVLFRAGVI